MIFKFTSRNLFTFMRYRVFIRIFKVLKIIIFFIINIFPIIAIALEILNVLFLLYEIILSKLRFS